MRQDSGHQVQLISCQSSHRDVVHLALGFQFSENVLLGAPAVVKAQDVAGGTPFIGHDHLEIIADIMRTEQIQLHRLFVLTAR